MLTDLGYFKSLLAFTGYSLFYILLDFLLVYPRGFKQRENVLAYSSFFSYLGHIGCKRERVTFFNFIMMCIDSILVGAFYVARFWVIDNDNDTHRMIVLLIGLFILSYPHIHGVFLAHLSKNLSSAYPKENTPLDKLRMRNSKFFRWFFFPAIVGYAAVATSTYFILGAKIAAFICSILYFFLLFLIWLYYRLKFLREKVFFACRLITNGGVRSVEEWGKALNLSSQLQEKYKDRIEEFLHLYGFNNVSVQSGQFVIKK